MCNTRSKFYIAVSFILIFSLIFSISVYASADSSVNVEIKLESATLQSNNHVGNEWSCSAKVNGKKIEEGKSISLKCAKGSKITLAAAATENDKIPDTGSSSKTIKVSTLKAGEAAKYPVKVVVKENRGRYSGNTATWVFNFVVTVKK